MRYRPSYTPKQIPLGKRALTTYISDQLFTELDMRAHKANVSRAEYVCLVLSHHIGIPSKASAGTTQGTVHSEEQAQAQARHELQEAIRYNADPEC